MFYILGNIVRWTLRGSLQYAIVRDLFAGELLACLDGVCVQHILEGKQEGSCNHTLSDLGSNTLHLLAASLSHQ